MLQGQVRKLEGQLKSMAQAASQEKTTGTHREERLRAQISELEVRTEAQNSRLRAETEKVRAFEERTDRIEKMTGQFLGTATALLAIRTVQPDEFFSARGIEFLSGALFQLRTQADQWKRRSAELTKVVDQFRESFQIDGGEDALQIVAAIPEIRARLERQQSAISKAKQRYAQLQSVQEEAAAESAELGKQLRDAAAQVAENKVRIRELENQIEMDQSLIIERESEVTRLHQALAEGEKSWAEAKARYDRKVQRLRNHAHELQAVIEQRERDLQEADLAIKGSEKKVADLELQIERIEREDKIRIEQLVREKKLAEAEAHQKIKNSESEFVEKFEEAKKRWDERKRRIIGFVLDQFRQFFNRKGAVDENSLRDVVVAVREELQRLKNSDDRIRTVVRANSSQKTDDAVALIMSHG
jgi:chromosome segregation ATPase